MELVPPGENADNGLIVPLAEGGVLTFEQSLVPHVHVEIEDAASVFGLAIPVGGASGGISHLFEHMVMRHDGGDGELQYLWDSNGGAVWCNATTTARCISFEIAGYTLDCFRDSCKALTSAVFGLEIGVEQFASETDYSEGRMTTELAVYPGTRASLLKYAVAALLGTDTDGQQQALTPATLRTWCADMVRPQTALWYTYGRVRHTWATQLVWDLVNSFSPGSAKSVDKGTARET